MFARVDEACDKVCGAVPESLSNFSFRELALSRGVRVSARVEGARLTYFSLKSDADQRYWFEAPVRYLAGAWPHGLGKLVDLGDSWRVQVELEAGENVFIG
jgi:hypothetical protein